MRRLLCNSLSTGDTTPSSLSRWRFSYHLRYAHLFTLGGCITLVFALGSITYSVLHGFYGRPVNLISTLKSALISFLRLLVTHLIVDLLVSLVTLLFICSLYFITKGLNLLGVLTWTSFIVAEKLSGGGDWNNWFFVAQIVITSPLLTLLLLYFFAAQTVLYMYCKAIRGELASDIVQESTEYGCLPFDDEKVPRFVYVVCN
ncbi:hypothetical protein LINGRAHAP2_LOCUS11124 [Linum grandiflorum]